MENFLIRCAKFMARDRPDIYTFEDALIQLRQWVASMLYQPDGIESSASGGFTLQRFRSDEQVEWDFFRDIGSFVFDEDFPEGDEEDWTTDSVLLT